MLKEIDYQLIYTATKREREIFLYLKYNYEKIPNLTAREVAQACYCSTTSVNRVCKKLNFNGYRELQTSVKYKLNHVPTLVQHNEIAGLDVEQIMEFKNNLSLKIPIYIYGEGASKVSCLYLYRQLFKLGYIVINLTDREFLYSLKDCTIIIISNSGETKKIITTVKRIQNNHQIKLMGITRANSTLNAVIPLAITHEVAINQLDKIQTEQQLHILLIINELISLLYYK